MQPIIEVNNLGKKYAIGEKQSYLALRDVLVNVVKKPGQLFFGKKNQAADNEFWALQDINFAVEPGEVIGIIGKNGAGKSTLLKILSQITPPTTGEIKLRGRIGSLLEVGTGFHPELTGRENIYLNGAILGMRKHEIDQKFDEIVAFSGVERFIDTPVKRYSSGMYVRLAFAVAAHLEPEILVVDEVLSVGDVEFQKKCLGKMQEVTKKEGRTVLFVSHNMSAVAQLCTKAIVLDQGKIKFIGDVNKAINIYTNEIHAASTEWEGEAGDEHIKLVRTWVRPLNDEKSFHTATDIEVGLEVDVKESINNVIMGFTLFSEFDYELAYVLYDDKDDSTPRPLSKGKIIKRFVIPKDTLAKGTYRIQFDLGIHMVKAITTHEGALEFTLDNIAGLGRRFVVPDVRGRSGLFRPDWGKD